MTQKKSLILAMLMLCVISFSALADVTKSEIIYAKLTAQGLVQQVFVVNSFETDEDAEIVDYGKYTRVQALGETAAFSYEGDEVLIKTKPGRFFYEGIPDDVRLPWEISLEYTLDGEKIVPDALSGKSGDLEILLLIQPVAGFEAYTNAMTIQATLTLDGDHSFDVRADRATMAWAGGNIALNFVVLPGQGASYAIKARVQDFTMPAFQLAGIKMAMDTQMYKDVASKALAGSPLETAVGGLMENFLNSMQGSDSPSFTDERNKIESLQFILMLQGIPKVEPAKAESQIEIDSKTFFDRFLGLFGL